MSKTFKFTVGPTDQEFIVHESVLVESPPLSRMCQLGFQEEVTGHVNLPEDNAEDFGCVLDYLYGNGCSINVVHPDGYSHLAGVYILSDKYQLGELKHLVMEKFRNSYLICPEIYFDVAAAIYSNVLETDNLFREYFKSTAPGIMLSLNDSQFEVVRPLLRRGGTLAEDIFDAEREAGKIRESRKHSLDLSDEEMRILRDLKERGVVDSNLTSFDLRLCLTLWESGGMV